VLLIHLHLDQVVASYHEQIRQSTIRTEVQSAYELIQRRLRRNRGRPQRARNQPDTPWTAKERWVDEWRKRTNGLPAVRMEEKIKLRDRGLWREWQAGLEPKPPRSYETTPTRLDPLTLHKHSQLRKAESTTLIQLRTGVLGLNATLSRLRVPDISEACRCGTGRETAAHFLL
jgi:hypothetical protein